MRPSLDRFSLYQADQTFEAYQSLWINDERLAVVHSESEQNNLWHYDLAAGDNPGDRRLTARGVYAGNSYTRDIDPFDVSPSGDSIAFITGGKWAKSHDLLELSLESGNLQPILSKPESPPSTSSDDAAELTHSHETGFELREPRYTPDGDSVVCVTDMWAGEDVAIASRDGYQLTNVTQDDRYNMDPRPHPDPEDPRIAYTGNRLQDFYDDFQVRVIDSRMGDIEIVAGGPDEGNAMFPSWSPDGDSLYYSNDGDGYEDIYRWDATTGETERLTSGDTLDYDPQPHPSDPLLAFTHEKDGVTDIGILDLEDGTVETIPNTKSVVHRPRWNESGSLSFVANDHETPAVVKTKADLTATPVRRTSSGTDGLSRVAIEPTSVTIESTDVHALVYTPDESIRNHAGLVYSHGGPTGVVRDGWNPWIQFFANRGFTVVAPNFRGSDGFGREHRQAIYGDWAGSPFEDVLATTEYLAGLEHVDGDRIGIWGQSYGALMTILGLARAPETFAAGAAFYGAYDRGAHYNLHDNPTLEGTYWANGGQSDISHRLMLKQMGPIATNREKYIDISPIHDVANISSPVMLFQGLQDLGPSAPTEFLEKLEQHDKVFEYHSYEDQGHGFHGEGFVDAFSRAANFFEKYLTEPPE